MAKWFKTYGVPKERFDNYQEIIQQGNDTSLGAVVVISALVLTVYTAIKYFFNWELEATVFFTLIEILIAISYFTLAKLTKGYHYIFFYLSVEVLVVFGAYAMSTGRIGAIFLYPAVVVLLPLFYMHNMAANCAFFGINYAVFLILAYLGPENCRYMRQYAGIVAFFTVVGLIIHYVYQSNRLRELINYQDSIEQRGA
ncbi:MAG: hypothetical protein K5644_05735, partial [Lachnospiraceae bacterium]|nr:hypothetical protein [Lachnospiraceae bacterium]